MTRISVSGERQWRPGGSRLSQDKDPNRTIRVGELGLGTEAKEESRVLQLVCRDPDPYLFLRSGSEATVTSSERFPGHGALGADPASLGKIAERRQEHRTAAIAERGKFGKLEC